jgi:hypothetical protein
MRKVPAMRRVLRALMTGRFRLVFIILETRMGRVVLPAPDTKKVALRESPGGNLRVFGRVPCFP